MEKIASFTINHEKLEPGIYVSRKDKVGAETLTTFDLRMTRPNREPHQACGRAQQHLRGGGEGAHQEDGQIPRVVL